MKLHLEADPAELTEKSGKILGKLSEALAPVAPELSEALEKALPAKEPVLKYKVLRELQKRTEELYKKQMAAMVKDIMAVLTRSVSKSDAEEIEKALYIGPRGGKWANAEHTIHWEPGMDQPKPQAAPEEQGPGRRAAAPEEVGERREAAPEEEGAGRKEAAPEVQPTVKPEAAPEVSAAPAKAEGPTKERYSKELASDKLMAMGDALYSAQEGMHNVIDGQGLNSMDFVKWLSVRGNLNAMKLLLKKYKGQLSAAYGEDEYHKVGLSDPFPASQMQPIYHSTYGSLMLPINGILDKATFQKYLATMKGAGMKFDGDAKAWYVPKHAVPGFMADFDAFKEKMAALNIEIMPPKGNAPKPPGPAEVVEEALPTEGEVGTSADKLQNLLNGIHSGHIGKTIAVVHDPETGLFSFHAYYNKTFNTMFSNTSGQLTGITKFNENTKARETFQLELAEEAIEKLKSLLPGYKIVSFGVKEARDKRNQEIAELQKPIPEVQSLLDAKFNLMSYQNECVRFLDKCGGNALIGDEMGLGKTLEVMAWAAKEDKKVLVVCPKVVRRNWVNEAHKFFPGHFQAAELVASQLGTGDAPDLASCNLAVVNYQSLEKFKPLIEKAGFNMLIVDESHRMSNPKAKQTMALMSIGKLPDMKNHVLLSGTAIKNKAYDLATQLEMVAPGKWTKDSIKHTPIGTLWLDMRHYYLARQKSAVLKDLPEKTTSMVNQEVENLPDMSHHMTIGEFSELKKSVADGKAASTTEMVQEILDSSDSKILVFTDSVEAAKTIAAKLGDIAILHHGEMADEDKEAAKKEFQRTDESGKFISPKRVFVGTRQSCGEGATLTAADKVVFNDLPWTAAAVRQAEDRAHRVGQKNAVNVYWNVAHNNAFDANVCDILRRKYALSQALNQGKQLTKEELAWMHKTISPEEVLAQIQGKVAGPEQSPDAKADGVEEQTPIQATEAAIGEAAPKPKKKPVEAVTPATVKPVSATPAAQPQPKAQPAAPEPPAKPAEAPVPAPTAPEGAKALGESSLPFLEVFLSTLGGKIRPHQTDPDKVVIKVPKNNPGLLAQIQKTFGIEGGKIIQGSQYIMQEVPKSQLVAVQKSLNVSEFLDQFTGSVNRPEVANKLEKALSPEGLVKAAERYREDDDDAEPDPEWKEYFDQEDAPQIMFATSAVDQGEADSKLDVRGAPEEPTRPKRTPVLQKSRSLYIGPRGGRWSNAEHTIHYEPEKPHKWAAAQGGKVSPHLLDPENMVMLKVPKEKAGLLEQLKKEHGISGEVTVGEKYAMLPVPKPKAPAEAAEVAEEVEPQEKKPEPKPESPDKGPVYAKTPWKPSKTVEEAQSWAAKLGISVQYPDIHTANAVNRALAGQHEMVLHHIQFLGTSKQLGKWAADHPKENAISMKEAKHPADLVHFHGVGGGVIAKAWPYTAKPYTKSVVLMNDSYYKESYALGGSEENYSHAGYFSGPANLTNTLDHEFGHVEGFVLRHMVPPGGELSCWEVWKKYAVKQLKSHTGKAEIMSEISQYAATNPHECWAEVAVMRRLGKTLPEWVQKAIDEMGIDKTDWAEMLKAGEGHESAD